MLPVTNGGEVPLTQEVVTGVAKERVDAHTLQLLDDLFPGHHGLEFAARILRLAEAKQLILPELGCAEVADVAVITIQSIRALAKYIGWSYDTTEKYLVVLCCLRLLCKKRYRHQIVLYFPLCRYQLPEPEILDMLQESRPQSQTPKYRPKVRNFARQVQRRFVLVRKKGDFDATSSPDLASSSRLPHLLLEDIRDILWQEVDSETANRLLLKIEGKVRYHCSASQSLLFPKKGDSEGDPSHHQSLLFPKKGDSEPGKEIIEGTLHQQKAILSGRKGDSLESPLILQEQESPFSEPKGDSSECALLLRQQKATLSGGKGDSEGDPSHHQSLLFPKKGDSVEVEGADNEEKPISGTEKGDSVFAASGSLNVNGNNIYITNNKGDDNVNDPQASGPNQADCYSKGERARVAYQLAMFLDKSPENKASFVKCCKEHTRTVIRASIIDMAVHTAFPTVDPADERGRPRVRAAWFHDALRRYAQPGTRIPAFVEKWLRTDLSWQEIERDLMAAAAKYGCYMVGGTSDQVRRWLRGEISEEELEVELALAEQQRAGRQVSGSIRRGNVALSPDKLWLDEAEARLLTQVMLEEIAAFCDEIAALGGDLPREAKTTIKQKQGEVYEVELHWAYVSIPIAFSSLFAWRAYVEEQREGEKKDLARAARRN